MTASRLGSLARTSVSCGRNSGIGSPGGAGLTGGSGSIEPMYGKRPPYGSSVRPRRLREWKYRSWKSHWRKTSSSSAAKTAGPSPRVPRSAKPAPTRCPSTAATASAEQLRGGQLQGGRRLAQGRRDRSRLGGPQHAAVGGQWCLHHQGALASAQQGELRQPDRGVRGDVDDVVRFGGGGGLHRHQLRTPVHQGAGQERRDPLQHPGELALLVCVETGGQLVGRHGVAGEPLEHSQDPGVTPRSRYPVWLRSDSSTVESRCSQRTPWRRAVASVSEPRGVTLTVVITGTSQSG